MEFTYASAETQIAYSAGRHALAEWWRLTDRWMFAGWLWEGQVSSLAHAHTLTAQYVTWIAQ